MTTATAPNVAGLAGPAYICPPDVADPFSTVEWELRDTWVKDYKTGKAIFEQHGVECPKTWSQEACNVAASKYFFGLPGTPQRETSVRQLIHRVARTVADWAHDGGYCDTKDEREQFYKDLVFVLLHQFAAFNSPVWFNLGLHHVYGTVSGGGSKAYWYDPALGRAVEVDPMVVPQGSACFILKMRDDIDDIWDRAKDSARLFKYGSGVGMDLSPIRSRYENLSGGGKASGPISFGKLIDCTGGTIKSGGRTRRAAIMLTIKDWHPEFKDFIQLKMREEAKAKALISAGYDPDFNGEAYGTVGFQNANLSVRLSDEFMEAALTGQDWQTRWVTDPAKKGPTHKADECLREVAKGTWLCGDPGVQFETTIQRFHTCPNTEPINSSNPCCFVGETLVDTSEGRVPISTLAEMDLASDPMPLAFCYDPDNRRPTMRRITRAWCSGRTKRLVRVRTDKGVELTCTPNHRFMTYSGDYVRAVDLKPGTSLRKIARHVNAARSRRVMVTDPGCGNPNKTEYQSIWMWERVNGPVPDGYEVHHRNGDPTDDRVGNFMLKTVPTHRSEHATCEGNPRFLNVPDVLLLRVYDYLDRRPNQKGGPSVTVGRWNAAVKKLGLSGIVPAARIESGLGRIQGVLWDVFVTRLEGIRATANDKVESVEVVTLDVEVPVYDVEVEGLHNFAVTNRSDSGSGTIVVHNSEFMFLDDTSCNLASLRLTKFRRPDGTIDVDLYRRVLRVMFTAQEVLVGRVSYPTARVAEMSYKYRPLGIGYADLGALLMVSGLAYDSDEGRALCGAMTAIMTGESYRTSARMAAKLGAFDGFEPNRDPMMNVMRMHRAAVNNIHASCPDYLRDAAYEAWDGAIELGELHGYRNAQASVLAPTGTISFLMDCDTTGGEPELGLVKYKNLAGGGSMKITNRLVEDALVTLGYDKSARDSILAYVYDRGGMEGCPLVKEAHVPVFDTSFQMPGGKRSIHWKGHIDMMVAAQPFISGAISKTVNLPKDATEQEIYDAIVDGWKKELKALAMYRDGSKWSQPLSTSEGGNNKTGEDAPAPAEPFGARKKLPKTRDARTHHFSIAGHDGYVTAGMYPDGTLGEVFIKMNKEGSTSSGLMDAIGITTSFALQHGCPLGLLVEKVQFMDFEPRGFTGNRDIPIAKSIVDYVFRWLGLEFGKRPDEVKAELKAEAPAAPAKSPEIRIVTGPPCTYCGSMTQRSGSCFYCHSCGNSSGGCG